MDRRWVEAKTMNRSNVGDSLFPEGTPEDDYIRRQAASMRGRPVITTTNIAALYDLSLAIDMAVDTLSEFVDTDTEIEEEVEEPLPGQQPSWSYLAREARARAKLEASNPSPEDIRHRQVVFNVRRMVNSLLADHETRMYLGEDFAKEVGG